MISSRHLLAATIAFSLAADPSSARVNAVGFVSHADRAYMGEALASPGSCRNGSPPPCPADPLDRAFGRLWAGH